MSTPDIPASTTCATVSQLLRVPGKQRGKLAQAEGNPIVVGMPPATLRRTIPIRRTIVCRARLD